MRRCDVTQPLNAGRLDSERAHKAALADMFKALGGGWEAQQ